MPLNARISIAEAVQMLNNSESHAIIVGEELVDALEGVRSQLDTVRCYIATSKPAAAMVDYETLLAGASSEEPQADVDLDDVVSIEYTSGTSGSLKAAVLTHRCFLAMSKKQLLIPGLDLDQESVMCHVAPVTHGTVAMVLPTIVRGGCNLIMPGFNPEALLETIEKERVTHIMLVPTMINFLLTHPDLKKYDLSSIRTMLYSASPMPAERVKEAVRTFGPVLIQNYGSHEASALVTYLGKEDHMFEGDPKKAKRLASAGIPCMETRCGSSTTRGKTCRPARWGKSSSAATTP